MAIVTLGYLWSVSAVVFTGTAVAGACVAGAWVAGACVTPLPQADSIIEAITENCHHE